MHSVMRKRQGLPYQKEEPKGLLANARHLAHVEARAGSFPTDDLGLAYGTRAHPKLVKQCVDPKPELRNRALAHVCEQVRFARETASFLPAGLVPALNESAEDVTDAESRTLATAVRRIEVGRGPVGVPGVYRGVEAATRHPLHDRW